MTFVVVAFVMVLLMFAASITVAFAQHNITGMFKASVNEVKRWSGWVLILVGLWLIVLGIWADFFTIYLEFSGSIFKNTVIWIS